MKFKVPKPSFELEALEPRILLSADGLGAGGDAGSPSDSDGSTSQAIAIVVGAEEGSFRGIDSSNDLMAFHSEPSADSLFKGMMSVEDSDHADPEDAESCVAGDDGAGSDSAAISCESGNAEDPSDIGKDVACDLDAVPSGAADSADETTASGMFSEAAPGIPTGFETVADLLIPVDAVEAEFNGRDHVTAELQKTLTAAHGLPSNGVNPFTANALSYRSNTVTAEGFSADSVLVVGRNHHLTSANPLNLVACLLYSRRKMSSSRYSGF